MMCLFAQTADGQEAASGIQSSSDHPPEIYGAIYVLGSLAKNRNLDVGSEALQHGFQVAASVSAINIFKRSNIGDAHVRKASRIDLRKAG